MAKATLKSIAKTCGVSISAVALALKEPQKLSKTVRDKIIDEAIKQGYFYNKQTKINKITLIFNKFQNYYMGEYYHNVVFGILQRLQQNRIIIQILDNFDIEYSEIHGSSGFIFVGNIPLVWLEKAERIGLPYILCGHPAKKENILCIIPDFANGYEQVLEYIVSCGHKNIGLITGETSNDDPLKIIIKKTYKNTLLKAGLKYSEKNIIEADYNNMQSLRVAFNKLISLTPKLSAIQLGNDVFAYLALQEAKRNGINIPKDVSIAGFDGTDLPWFLETPQYKLTTVWIDTLALGEKAVDLLIEIIKNPQQPKKNHYLPVKLLIRDTIRRFK